MQLKVSTDYAIRIVLYIAIKEDLVTSKELSEKLGIPQSFVFKVGRKLSENNILYSITGTQGGFSLKRNPEDISMFDVVNTMEKTTKINRCLEEDKYCSRFATEDCPVRKVYCKMQKDFEDGLRNMTVKDLL